MPFVFYVALSFCLVVGYLNYEKHHPAAAVVGILAPLAPVAVHWLAVEVSWLRTQESWAPTLIADLVGLGLGLVLLTWATVTAITSGPRVESERIEVGTKTDLLLT